MTTEIPPHLDPKTYPRTLNDTSKNIHLQLTYTPLDATQTLAQISSPASGANVLFVGTTRDTFDNRLVKQLSYTSYAPLALKTLMGIARDACDRFGLLGISIAHRLGVVPVCEASIVVGVSSGHRTAGWRAGEEVLELVKDKVEIWKREVFVDDETGEGVWRANRDRDGDGLLRV